jgi:hypothetical protein
MGAGSPEGGMIPTGFEPVFEFDDDFAIWFRRFSPKSGRSFIF